MQVALGVTFLLLLLNWAQCAQASMTMGAAKKSRSEGGGDGAKIKHIVVLMEENRSFDHLLGWYRRPRKENLNTADKGEVGLNGLDGSEFNFINVSAARDGTNTTFANRVYVDSNAPYINICDPDHNLDPTTFKIFGPDKGNSSIPNKDLSTPDMSGFVMFERDHYLHSQQQCGVLSMFDTRDKLPVLTKLVDEFAVMDHFFSSVPGPTWPNRQFVMSGQSNGLMATNPWFRDVVGELFPQETIFDQITSLAMEEENRRRRESSKKGSGSNRGEDDLPPSDDNPLPSWKVYFGDAPWELYMEALAHSPENIQPLDQFLVDASEGTLPSFSFIDPRAGINVTSGEGCNDEHPDHDVAVAEGFYKQIYEALRQGPAWSDTLFVLTYDEHGGFYDHVPTPLKEDGVPEPIPLHPDHPLDRVWSETAMPHQYVTSINDKEKKADGGKADGGKLPPSFPDPGFTFDRLGLRVPTVLISPWIDAGMVVGRPEQSKSYYDLTSIISTARKLLFPSSADKVDDSGSRLPPLTARDAWSATFERLFELRDSPRTDCPWTLPAAPDQTLSAQQEAELPLNSLQNHIHEIHRGLLAGHYPVDEEGSTTANTPADSYPIRQGDVSPLLQRQYQDHAQRTLHWKCTKSVSRNQTTTTQMKSLQQGKGLPLQTRRSSLLTHHRTEHCSRTEPFDHHRSEAEKGNLLRYEVQLVPSSFLFTTFPFQFTLNKPNVTPAGDDGGLNPPRYRETLSIDLPVYNVTHSVKAAFCLDTHSMSEGDQVGVSLCYPSLQPLSNRDEGQWWVWHGDNTIRPAKDATLCLKNEFFTSLKGVTNRTAWLAKCHGKERKDAHALSESAAAEVRSEAVATQLNGIKGEANRGTGRKSNLPLGTSSDPFAPIDDMEMHYAYGGKAPGEVYDGQIAFGITSLMIVPVPAQR